MQAVRLYSFSFLMISKSVVFFILSKNYKNTHMFDLRALSSFQFCFIKYHQDYGLSLPFYPLLVMLPFQNNLLDCMQAQQIQRREQDKQRRYIKVQSKAFKSQKFEFKTYELAFTVRQILYEKIIQFDANGDMQFQQSQIREFLISILHQMETQIHYFIKNVFRYDVNNDGVIEYDELVNFCMEQHLGEIAIQRLHRQKIYSKGSQRMMSQEEFTKTINYALSFLQFKPAPAHLQVLFRSVDIDNDGDISYQDYFRFLKEYFGSKSFAAKLVNTSTILEEIKHSKQHPNEKKDLDVVRKYSKYQNNLNQDGGSIAKKNIINSNNFNGNGSGNSNPASKSNIISSGKNNNEQINNNKNLAQSQIQNQGGNQNSNQNGQSMINSNVDSNNNNLLNPGNNIQPKGRPSIPPGIAMTISNKQPNKSKEIIFSQPQNIVSSRIARLVLTQLKVALINLDVNKTMALTAEDLTKYLRNRLNFTENNIQSIIKRGGLQKDKRYSYEEAAKFVIIEFIIKIFTQANFNDLSKPTTLEDFVALLQRICSIVPNSPLLQKYQQLFKMIVGRLGNFDYNDSQSLTTHIFNSYTFKH